MRLTIIIPIFLDREDAENVKKIIDDYCDVPFIFLNNNTNEKFEWAINNKVNGEKFWSVVNNLKFIETEYFLTIDPDDILNKSINWDLLKVLRDKLSTEDFNFGVNSYYEIRDGISQKIEYNDFNKIFNACAIYNTRHLEKTIYESGIVFEGEEQTYYEDFIMCIASSLQGKAEFFDIPFYGYKYRAGISKDWTLYKKQIESAWLKIEKLLNKYGTEGIDDKINDRIINININRVKERGKK